MCAPSHSFPSLTVLSTLRTRFEKKEVYTYCGIVLVAINPFQDMPERYTEGLMHNYHDKQLGELDPHIYALAEEVRVYIHSAACFGSPRT